MSTDKHNESDNFDETDKPSEEARLRTHPAKRFASRERKVDLSECYEQLLGEKHEGVDGHRQIALSHRGSLTVILFHFDEGSRIPEHVVNGEVTIHVLDGKLDVETAEQVHHLESGQILLLEDGVEHDVHALTESRMLLTVQLKGRLTSRS